jgi:hypothetical protein
MEEQMGNLCPHWDGRLPILGVSAVDYPVVLDEYRISFLPTGRKDTAVVHRVSGAGSRQSSASRFAER